MSTPRLSSGRRPELALREQLSSLQTILALVLQMIDSEDEHEILQLAATAVADLSVCRSVGMYLADGGWQLTSEDPLDSNGLANIRTQLAVVSHAGGVIGISRQAWGWAFPLRSSRGSYGFLVVAAEAEPTDEVQFRLRLLAQQAGIAIASSRLHAQQRHQATELRAMNAQLVDTVAALERRAAIHDHLTRVVVAGEGHDGIAQAMHQLIGLPVVIEDRHGNLLAWAGPSREAARPKASRAQQEALLRRGLLAGRPIRDNEYLLVVVQLQVDVIALLALFDPDDTAGEDASIVLECGATLLSMDMARLSAIAQTELRLRRDLVEDLLTGTDDVNAAARSEALGYDLKQGHRTLVVECGAEFPDYESLLQAVREAVRDAGSDTLITARGHSVVIVADTEQPWEVLAAAIERELHERRPLIGVGGLCNIVADLPRSYRQALLALRVLRLTAGQGSVIAFDQLGVYGILAGIDDFEELERFARTWLDALIEYDTKRGSPGLVLTLGRYFSCGGNYDTTAHSLSVSRSTLKYRLQRIREISGHDLGDPETKFNLQFALRAWRTLIGLRTSNV